MECKVPSTYVRAVSSPCLSALLGGQEQQTIISLLSCILDPERLCALLTLTQQNQITTQLFTLPPVASTPVWSWVNLEQEFANYGLWASSILLLVFVSKVYWKGATLIHLRIVYGSIAELSLHGPHNLIYLPSGPLQRQFADPWCRVSLPSQVGGISEWGNHRIRQGKKGRI